MRISGFTIIRNAIDYDFPVIECIKSMLELVDEFVIALGDSTDKTDELISTIKSDKIKIIKSKWDSSKFHTGGHIFANQTDIALKACTGDWCMYVQGDEILHETAVPIIREACEKYLNDNSVEGFLLRYVHLYGDYKHYINARHFGYPKEVRIVRNLPDVHSWKDAQSFRIMPNFDCFHYSQKKHTRLLNCILLKDAYLYHYGWSRDPRKMIKKKALQNSTYSGKIEIPKEEYFDYGNLSCMPVFKGVHPKVMEDRIKAMDWQKYIRYTGERPQIRKIFAPRYRVLTYLENKFLKNGNRIFGFKNYKQIGIF